MYEVIAGPPWKSALARGNRMCKALRESEVDVLRGCSTVQRAEESFREGRIQVTLNGRSAQGVEFLSSEPQDDTKCLASGSGLGQKGDRELGKFGVVCSHDGPCSERAHIATWKHTDPLLEMNLCVFMLVNL